MPWPHCGWRSPDTDCPESLVLWTAERVSGSGYGSAVTGRLHWTRSAGVVVAALLVGVIAAGCSSSGDDDGVGASSGATSTEPVVVVGPEPLTATVDPPTDGMARVVMGAALDVTLEVETCERDPGATPDGEVPAERITVVARGASADGTPVVLDMRRFVSQGAAPTITDTVTVLEGTEDSPERVLQAQRFEVGGTVTDLRDPDADDSLVRVTDAAVTATGVYAPPGGVAGDAGLVEGAVAVTCSS